MRRPSLGLIGLGIVIAGLAVMLLGSAVSGSAGSFEDPRIAGFGPGSMMGWTPAGAERWLASTPGPGEVGFVAGTAAAPRVVRIVATAGLRFVPATVTVAKGETITFEVTAMGMATHEFMVGPAADVVADRTGTPEIADIVPMLTKSITYTFDGPGPYAFACHAPGHYEAGMAGLIVVV